MKLLLRPQDRCDRQERPTTRRGQIFASGGICQAMSQRAVVQNGAAPIPQLPAAAWRVPGFTRPARLSRSDWLIRGFDLLSRSGHHALNIALRRLLLHLIALIVQLPPFAQTEQHFRAPFVEIHFQRDQR